MMADEEFQKGNFRRIRGAANIAKAGVAKHQVLVKLLKEERGKKDTAKASELMIAEYKEGVRTNARKACAGAGCCRTGSARSFASEHYSTSSCRVGEDAGRRGSDGGGHSHLTSEAGGQEVEGGYEHYQRGPAARKSITLPATKAAAIESLRMARKQDYYRDRDKKEGKCRACNRSFSSSGYSGDSRADGKDSEPTIKGPVEDTPLIGHGPTKRSTKEQDLQALRDQQRKQAEDNEQYADIKVPPEFIAQFEIERGFAAGDTAYAPREIQDEIRIRYL